VTRWGSISAGRAKIRPAQKEQVISESSAIKHRNSDGFSAANRDSSSWPNRYSDKFRFNDSGNALQTAQVAHKIAKALKPQPFF
jgi:hypothetical protein